MYKALFVWCLGFSMPVFVSLTGVEFMYVCLIMYGSMWLSLCGCECERVGLRVFESVYVRSVCMSVCESLSVWGYIFE